MDKIAKRLKVLESMSKRIEGLASVRGTPADIVSKLKQEHETIQWAHEELLQSHFHRVLCVIGQEELVREVVEPYIYGVTAGGVAWAICIDPDEVLAAKVHEDLIGKKDHPGNRLPDEKNTSWITCDRYYAVGDDADPTRRALLVSCLVSRPWYSSGSADAARVMIGTWLDNLYNSMRWDEHTRV